MRSLHRKDIFMTGLITLSAFFSTGYVACTKDSTNAPDACSTVNCKNNGVCFKGVCSCPVGYDGATCEIKALNRYIGKWNTKEVIYGSTNSANVGDTQSYLATIREGANAASFLIDNFRGNATYNNVSCRIGENKDGNRVPNNRFSFTRDQRIEGTDLVIDFGEGTVNESGTVMTGYYIITYPVPALNGFVTDSVGFESFFD